MMSPKISVITPNFNYSVFIGLTIDSIIDQNYCNFEHIIVDDGSTDSSVDIVQSYVDRFPDKIKLIKQSNLGQSSALNRALNYVTGDIICWINSDDIFLPDAFKTVVNYFEKNKTVDAVFGNILIINKIGDVVRTVKYLPFDYNSGIYNGFGKVIPSNGIFWRRTIGFNPSPLLFNPNLHYAMDSDYWSRMLVNRTVMHLNQCFAGFRYHDDAKTIKRIDASSEAFRAARAEDQYVYLNALNKTKLKNLPFQRLIYYLYKVKRIFLKAIHGHYYNG